MHHKEKKGNGREAVDPVTDVLSHCPRLWLVEKISDMVCGQENQSGSPEAQLLCLGQRIPHPGGYVSETGKGFHRSCSLSFMSRGGQERSWEGSQAVTSSVDTPWPITPLTC